MPTTATTAEAVPHEGVDLDETVAGRPVAPEEEDVRARAGRGPRRARSRRRRRACRRRPGRARRAARGGAGRRRPWRRSRRRRRRRRCRREGSPRGRRQSATGSSAPPPPRGRPRSRRPGPRRGAAACPSHPSRGKPPGPRRARARRNRAGSPPDARVGRRLRVSARAVAVHRDERRRARDLPPVVEAEVARHARRGGPGRPRGAPPCGGGAAGRASWRRAAPGPSPRGRPGAPAPATAPASSAASAGVHQGAAPETRSRALLLARGVGRRRTLPASGGERAPGAGSRGTRSGRPSKIESRWRPEVPPRRRLRRAPSARPMRRRTSS